MVLSPSSPRPEGAAEVRYAESSMKDGYGLMHLHKFLSVPFLQLQVCVCVCVCERERERERERKKHNLL